MIHGTESDTVYRRLDNTKSAQKQELPSVGGMLLGYVAAHGALCVVVADAVVFPLAIVSSVIAACLVEQGHVEVSLEGRVMLGIIAQPGRRFTLVVQVGPVHVVGHAYVVALVHLVLNAIDVEQAGCHISTYTASKTR